MKSLVLRRSFLSKSYAPRPRDVSMWRLWLLCAVEGATVARHEAYEAFRRLHGRGSSDYERRLATFLRRSEEVQRQNARGTWRARLNKFADLSDSELEAMRSYHGHRPRRGRSLLQTEQKAMRRDAQGAKTWRGLRSALFVRSQGGCGSCWADAAAGALEMRAEIARGLVQRLSSAQLLRCTPNPEHCGGDGGCSGATAELAFGLAAHRGVALEGHDDCAAPPAVRPRGFVRLPENQLEPLLAAVSEGPVVVSVDAGAWTLYDSGIFDSCKRDATINHAVLMVGYGSSEGKKYWLIRNSWGADWGEQGYMRLLRHDGDFCGTDYDPKVGVGCRGGPASLPVCGMCGVLSDSSYPQF